VQPSFIVLFVEMNAFTVWQGQDRVLTILSTVPLPTVHRGEAREGGEGGHVGRGCAPADVRGGGRGES